MKTATTNPLTTDDLIPIRRVLISLSDKTHLKELCATLAPYRCEIVATSSTYSAIRSLGFPCTPVEDITKFPEILGGRVKTLHPSVFGGILRKRCQQDERELKAHGIAPFDAVICNLYPFHEAATQNLSQDELIEKIDIGGVSLLRAAAKNFSAVVVLCDTQDYPVLKNCLQHYGGKTPAALRATLAAKAFAETAAYDNLIATTLKKQESRNPEKNFPLGKGPIVRSCQEKENSFPETITLSLTREKILRYGENAHQQACLYKKEKTEERETLSLCDFKTLQGKELSYNNMLDIEHTLRLIKDLIAPFCCAIIKHNVPCGVGVSETSLAEAFAFALESDPVSAFGGVLGLTENVDAELAEKLCSLFLEVIIAPSFSQEALDKLQSKKNLRLLTYQADLPLSSSPLFTPVQGGFLVQEQDRIVFEMNEVTCPTRLKPDQTLWDAFLLGMTVVKHCRSNAIVIANKQQTLSIAGGFTSRIDAVEHCLKKVKPAMEGAILASDAFFPFPDSIEAIAKAGIQFVIQPGGSIQDAQVVKACDLHGIAMVFTGHRHFKH